MTKYSVKQLSELAGVSVRALHHYDRIDLLKPALRTEKGYRYYGRDELLKLQQILFYKELDVPLKKIRAIVNDPDFDLIAALERHRERLTGRSERLQRLLITINSTIDELQQQHNMMTDKDIYAGFSEDEAQAMRTEVTERWGAEQLAETEERIRALGKDGWQDAQAKGEEINRLLADVMDLDPADSRVQQAVALHYRHMNIFYEVTEQRYRGLGKMYTEDPRFTAYYEKYRPGLADFLHRAIEAFCDAGRAGRAERDSVSDER